MLSYKSGVDAGAMRDQHLHRRPAVWKVARPVRRNMKQCSPGAFGVDDSRSGKFRIRGKNAFQFVNVSLVDGVRNGFCNRIVCPDIHG